MDKTVGDETSELTEIDVFGSDEERILVVDDERMLREVTSTALAMEGYKVESAASVDEALAIMDGQRFDLILSDIRMPNETGVDLMRYCREQEYDLPFILMSGFADSQLIIDALNLGASFFLSKPFSIDTLTKRVDSVLSTRRYEKLHGRMMEYLKQNNMRLEKKVQERTSQLEKTQDAIGMVLSGMAETRDPETGEHLARTRAYVRCLGEALLETGIPVYAQALGEGQLGVISRATILHDVGKVGVPDHILLKPDKLTADEFEEMKKHTIYGSYVFDRAIEFCGEDPFLLIARSIARFHHERWDGAGYPDGLSGEAIPLAARIMAVADVYDALVNKRCYKEAMPHDEAEKLIMQGAGTQFDPMIVDMFFANRKRFMDVAVEFQDMHLGNGEPSKGIMHIYE